ncbi:MAG TPA: hypothetical protein VMI94_13000 [Bryobacteraceae bacterium]|nr:hypothetical protein [Bryobacteraceae bacterium]
MRLSVFVLMVTPCVAALAQQAPLASFTGTVREITSTSLTLTRTDQEDMEISCTHKTHYFSGSKKIRREDIKPGDRVTVETKLDLYMKPEAVNVRLLPPEAAPQERPPSTVAFNPGAALF